VWLLRDEPRARAMQSLLCHRPRAVCPLDPTTPAAAHTGVCARGAVRGGMSVCACVCLCECVCRCVKLRIHACRCCLRRSKSPLLLRELLHVRPLLLTSKPAQSRVLLQKCRCISYMSSIEVYCYISSVVFFVCKIEKTFTNCHLYSLRMSCLWRRLLQGE
jgi:hypothetical protein